MPIGGTPILVHLMKIYAEQGFTRFILAAGHRKEILYDYFDGRFLNWDIQVVDTGAESDTGERIRRCAPHASGDTFFATYGDGLGDVDLRSLQACHKRYGGLGTLTTVPLRSQYGTVQIDDGSRVEQFIEKPVIHDCRINAGFFVFEREAFEIEGMNLESHILPKLAARNQLFAYQHFGFWKSMDTSKDQQEMESLLQADRAPWELAKQAAMAVAG